MRASVRAICTVLIVTAVATCGNSSAADPVTCGWDNGIFDSVPPPIGNPTTVWTGSHLFVWGRRDVGPAVGWLYDPSADRWTRTSESGAPEEFTRAVAAWTGTEVLLWNSSDSRIMLHKYDPALDIWSTANLTGAPSLRVNASAVWTGDELIVWGGQNGAFYFTDGARYDPVLDSWQTMTSLDAPQGRSGNTALWTGSAMIVWGGYRVDSGFLNDGALYDPIADVWTPIVQTGAPPPRVDHTAVWTGNELIVWGGSMGGAGLAGDGGRYDPVAEEWTPVSLSGAPTPRRSPRSVWSGSEMIVWGGADANFDPLQDGARYDPLNDLWFPVAPSDAPAKVHTATWTGTEMIVWGGAVVGGRYDPSLDAWTPTFDPGMPPEGSYAGVWTGTDLIVWGSNSDGVQGGRYNLELDAWFPMSMDGAPTARGGHTAVWTGTEMIVWGGFTTNTGGRYNPETDSWAPTSLLSAPGGRALHSAVWTGTEMIVAGGVSAWPGNCPGDTLGSSAAYDPATDTWRTLSGFGERAGHVAVWTGSEVIVWGGHVGGTDESGYCAFANVVNPGGRYDPATSSWTSLSSSGRPQTTGDGVAVWTGTEMVVWGGYRYFESTGGQNWILEGGRYAPDTDSWRPVATENASARAEHMAVWAGTEMIVWGGVGNDLVVSGLYSPDADRWTPLDIEGQPDSFRKGPVVWTGELMIVWNGHGGRYRVGVSDVDGDGLTCGDNCPATSNVGQEDADADGFGDACDACFGLGPDADADAFCDASDNCPATSNPLQADADTDGVGNSCDLCPAVSDPGQADLDGDGSGDACDCQPGDPADLSPGTIDSLVITRIDPVTAQLDWVPEPGADAYAVQRGLLSALAAGEYGGCVDQIIAMTSIDDPDEPPLGDGFTYLIQGQSFDCGLGSLGFGPWEDPRFNDDADACQGLFVADAGANGDAPVYGDPSGTYSDTLASDGVVQTITEEESGGNPSSRTGQLEHRWDFTVPAGQRVELHVEGHRTASTDGDDFEFEYSVDGGNVWNATSLESLPLADDDQDQIALLPPTVSGSVMIRVIDTDRTPGSRDLDSVSIDELFLRSVP